MLKLSPIISPKKEIKEVFDLTNISTKEIYIITPAEKPIPKERNFVFVGFVKKAMAAPTPVESPASSVSKKAYT
jgi:hypothetical protein